MVSDALLSQLNDFVSARIGIHFPNQHLADLERGISSAALELGFREPESCIKWLVSSSLTQAQLSILAAHLTIGETYFFREKKTFEAFEKHILPGLIDARRSKDKYLRIWSAGCCSGEEPYSIAILLHKMIPDNPEWNIAILASDINPVFLQKAGEGIYSEWSFRNAPEWIRSYFRKTERGFEIHSCIKKMVTFFYHNLAEDTYPSVLNNTNAMDIIFCRNVLMYFSSEQAKKVIQNLFFCLVEGGWLIVSPVETSQEFFPQFLPVNLPETTIYLKNTGSRIEDRKTAIQKPAVDLASKLKRQEPNKKPIRSYENAAVAGNVKRDAGDMALKASAYANDGRSKEAFDWCEKAIAVDRLNPHYYYLRAMILQERGEIEKAVESLKRAIYLDPDFVLAHFAMGNLTRRQGKFKEAERYFETISVLLKRLRPDEILADSEGITAGRLSEIITTLRKGAS